MEVNVLNQNPCIPSWPGVFHFYYFSVVLSESMCIFTFCHSSSPSNSFPMLLVHSAFLLCSLGCYILLQNCLASLASSCWYVFVPSPRLVGRIFFRCFGMSCFVYYYFHYYYCCCWYSKIFNILTKQKPIQNNFECNTTWIHDNLLNTQKIPYYGQSNIFCL